MTNGAQNEVPKLSIGVTIWQEGQVDPLKMVNNKQKHIVSKEFNVFSEGLGLPDRFDEDYNFNDAYKGTPVNWLFSGHMSKEQIRRYIANATCLIFFKVCKKKKKKTTRD